MSDSSTNSAAFEITSKIMISAVIVFFIVVTFIFLLHLYARFVWATTPEDPEIVSWRRQLAGQNRPAGAARRPRGLKSSALKSLPVTVYSPEEFKEGLECAICLSELQEKEKVRVLPNCSHGFHLDCIDKWFHSHSTCPICRASVIAEAVQSEVEVEVQQEEIDLSEGGNSMEFPTNVLFWGDETEIRTSQELGSSENGGSLEVVIDVAMEVEEEERSPVMNRIRSLQRMLSRGKRVSPSPCSSSSS